MWYRRIFCPNTPLTIVACQWLDVFIFPYFSFELTVPILFSVFIISMLLWTSKKVEKYLKRRDGSDYVKKKKRKLLVWMKIKKSDQKMWRLGQLEKIMKPVLIFLKRNVFGKTKNCAHTALIIHIRLPSFMQYFFLNWKFTTRDFRI